MIFKSSTKTACDEDVNPVPEKPDDVRPSAVNGWLSGDNRTAKG
jgi:hypothetical protein